MDLWEYLESIDKNNCPKNCELKDRKTTIVTIPPPDEILGIIISRDPTVDWLYGYLKKEPDLNIRRKILFTSAIPLSLITKLLLLLRDEQVIENEKERIFDVIFQKIYWTHLHKCPTDAKGTGSIEFKLTNAMECANTWLGDELNCTIDSKTKFIIALGDDVQKWVGDWKKRENKNIEVINLPHPSGQNNPIWYRSNKDKYQKRIEKTKERIKRLIDLCKVN